MSNRQMIAGLLTLSCVFYSAVTAAETPQQVTFTGTAVEVVPIIKVIDVGVRNPDGQLVTVRRAFMYDERYG